MTDEQLQRLDNWYYLAKCNVRTTDEKHKQIAWFCFEAEQAGGVVGIWHASAAIHGHKCQCYQCYPFAGN